MMTNTNTHTFLPKVAWPGSALPCRYEAVDNRSPSGFIALAMRWMR
jgi:hypothetical protein